MESSKRQATFGKMAMNIIVVDIRGDKISFLKAIERSLAKMISGLIIGIGFIMIEFTKKKQGLHDIMIDTLVIIKEKEEMKIDGIVIVYAGFWRRLLAFMIDIFNLGLLFYFITTIASPRISSIDKDISDLAYRISTWFFMMLTWIYFTIFEYSEDQATIGKRIMRLKVVDANGNRISLYQSNLRFFCKILFSFLGIGFIPIAFSKKKQGIYDMIAHTIVIMKSKEIS
jgi:uncharacterized RDD family membrane protein YckC